MRGAGEISLVFEFAKFATDECFEVGLDQPKTGGLSDNKWHRFDQNWRFE